MTKKNSLSGPFPPKTASKSRAVSLPAAARSGGLMVFAPSGWGKSRLLGRSVIAQDVARDVGTVVIDAVGGTIDNALDKLAYLPEARQRAVLARVRYCNMAGERGSGGELCVPAFPMLSPQFPGEPPDQTAGRIVELIRKTDRALATASIWGLNRLAPLLTAIGMVLTALRRPISEADHFLDNPTAWQGRLTEAGEACPEVRPAVSYLQNFFLPLPDRERLERSDVLRNKLSLLRFNQVARTMFSAPAPQFSWDEVARDGLVVLIDLRGETDDRRRELKLFWVWNSLLEYVRYRGASGHRFPPLSVVIDELSFFVRGTTLNTDVIAEEFRELVQVRKRNANIWLTAATQEQLELPEAMLRACLQMGSQMFGATTEHETAVRMVKRFATLDPDLVKHWRNVWGSDGLLRSVVLEQEPVFRSLEEQEYLASRVFTELPKGTFLTATARGQGMLPGSLRPVSTRQLDPGLYVNEQLVGRLKRFLAKRDGLVVRPEAQPAKSAADSARGHDAQPAQVPAAQSSSTVAIGRRSPRRLPHPTEQGAALT